MRKIRGAANNLGTTQGVVGKVRTEEERIISSYMHVCLCGWMGGGGGVYHHNACVCVCVDVYTCASHPPTYVSVSETHFPFLSFPFLTLSIHPLHKCTHTTRHRSPPWALPTTWPSSSREGGWTRATRVAARGTRCWPATATAVRVFFVCRFNV